MDEYAVNTLKAHLARQYIFSSINYCVREGKLTEDEARDWKWSLGWMIDVATSGSMPAHDMLPGIARSVLEFEQEREELRAQRSED